jgi:release factor glutamine methyltransferase
MTAADTSTARAAASDARRTLAQGVARLEAARVPSAALAAELLLLHVFRRDRTWLYAHPEDTLSAVQHAEYASLLERRAQGVPVQYLTGRQEFWGLEFEVDTSVLIPRPETEHLIEVTLERLGERRSAPLSVADVGTGSGCLAVALAHELPLARIVATDISTGALQVAGRNASRHGVGDRITFVQANLLQPYLRDAGAAAPAFDLIVSNPPYVGRSERPGLQREVVEHEPQQALFAGEEGLDIYPQLIAQAGQLLRPGGTFVVELGYGLAARVAALIAEHTCWSHVGATNDLAGIPRVLAAERISA